MIGINSYGVIFPVRNDEIPVFRIDFGIFIDTYARSLDIRIEAKGAEHIHGKGTDRIATVHIQIGIIPCRIFDDCLHINIILAIFQRILNRHVQRQFMTFCPISRLRRYSDFFIAFQLVRNIFYGRMQQVFAMPRTSSCPVIVEEFNVIGQIRPKFPIFHHGNVQDAARRHIPVVIGTYGKGSSNLVIVDSEILCLISHALVNRRRALHHSYSRHRRCRYTCHQRRHN